MNSPRSLKRLRVSALIAFILMTLTGFANDRVALIIGNQNYTDTNYQTLPTCINDANAMNQALKGLGFSTLVITDATKDDMLDAFDRFADMAKGAKVAVYYFSGHATNLGGELFMVPSKTKFRKNSLSDQFVRVANIRDIMEDNSTLSLLFFDACRDGATSGARQTKGRTSVSGTPSNREANGYMLFYATQNGKTATVGNGLLSPFTQVLIEHLNDGDEFRDVWRYIKTEVPAIAPGQYPSSEELYGGNFYFNKFGDKTTVPNTNYRNVAQEKNVDTKSITINTNVPGSKIDFYGKTFDSGKPLTYKIGKKYTYTINVDGYLPYTGILNVVESSPSSVYITLKKSQPATLNVICNRDGASVYFDGKYMGLYKKNKPFLIETVSGKHSVKLTKYNYSTYETELDLTAGKNYKAAYLSSTKETPAFFAWDGDVDGFQGINYHYSPKYQIGLSYLYRFQESRFSLGSIIAFSTGIFRGTGVNTYSYSYVDSDNTYTADENGEQVTYRKETKYQFLDSDHYSQDNDPYKEAKTFDSNFLALANIGYNVCNGIMIEAGLGAGYHQDKIHMPNIYVKGVTTITNLTTGKEVGVPKVEYLKQSGSKWYHENSKWSPAARLGAKFFIPLDGWDSNYITIGGGYTFLFSNSKQNSWDINVGYVWTF